MGIFVQWFQSRSYRSVTDQLQISFTSHIDQIRRACVFFHLYSRYVKRNTCQHCPNCSVRASARVLSLLSQVGAVRSSGGAEIWTVETAPGGVRSALQVDADDAVFHANEYLRLSKIPQCAPSLISSQHRRSVFEKTNARNPIRSLEHALNDVLGDTSDVEYPVFRRDDATGADTLFTVAFDLRGSGGGGTAEVTVFRDNPRLGAQAVVLRERLWGQAGGAAGAEHEPVNVKGDEPVVKGEDEGPSSSSEGLELRPDPESTTGDSPVVDSGSMLSSGGEQGGKGAEVWI